MFPSLPNLGSRTGSVKIKTWNVGVVRKRSGKSLYEMTSSVTDKTLAVRLLPPVKLGFSDTAVLTRACRHDTAKLTARNSGLLSSASMVTRPLRYVVAYQMR